jgi:hypothetical protein
VPERTDSAELRATMAGRITCEAPFRYDRCAHSFVGDGDRAFRPWARLGSSGSGDIDLGEGTRLGGGFLASETESAWKNLLSGCDLPTADRGGETLGLCGGSSCWPLA